MLGFVNCYYIIWYLKFNVIKLICYAIRNSRLWLMLWYTVQRYDIWTKTHFCTHKFLWFISKIWIIRQLLLIFYNLKSLFNRDRHTNCKMKYNVSHWVLLCRTLLKGFFLVVVITFFIFMNADLNLYICILESLKIRTHQMEK